MSSVHGSSAPRRPVWLSGHHPEMQLLPVSTSCSFSFNSGS